MRPSVLPESCVADGHGCGSTSGWRNGGRCQECRSAHNAETAKWRRAKNAPPAEDISALAALLRNGMDLPAAARSLGIHPSTARALAQDHPQIAVALEEGEAEPESTYSRQSDYLRALLNHGGGSLTAAAAADVSAGIVTFWRQDPQFAAADDALRVFAGGRAAVPRKKWTPTDEEGLTKYLDCLAAGFTHAEASRQSKVSTSSVYHRAKADPQFSAKLEEIRPRGVRRKGRKRIDEALLRALWANPNLTQREVAARLGMSTQQTKIRAHLLGLGARPDGSAAPRPT